MPVTINGTTGITSPSKVLVGTSNSGLGISSGNGNLQVTNNGSNQLWMPRYSNDAFGSAIEFAKSRGTSIGSDVAVQVGDDLGYIEFRGWTGAAYPSSAVIQADVGAGTVSTTSLPSELRFFTTPDGSISNTERFRIAPSGQIGIGGANYGTSGQVLTSGGPGAAPSWQAASSMTLLGTLVTTSGTSQSLTSLDLTPYSFLTIVVEGISHNAGTNQLFLIGTSSADDIAFTGSVTSATLLRGTLNISLSIGTITGAITASAVNAIVVGGSNVVAVGGDCTITNASTSVFFAPSSGSFDAGSILVYGVR